MEDFKEDDWSTNFPGLWWEIWFWVDCTIGMLKACGFPFEGWESVRSCCSCVRCVLAGTVGMATLGAWVFPGWKPVVFGTRETLGVSCLLFKEAKWWEGGTPIGALEVEEPEDKKATNTFTTNGISCYTTKCTAVNTYFTFYIISWNCLPSFPEVCCWGAKCVTFCNGDTHSEKLESRDSYVESRSMKGKKINILSKLLKKKIHTSKQPVTVLKKKL